MLVSFVLNPAVHNPGKEVVVPGTRVLYTGNINKLIYILYVPPVPPCTRSCKVVELKLFLDAPNTLGCKVGKRTKAKISKVFRYLYVFIYFLSGHSRSLSSTTTLPLESSV